MNTKICTGCKEDLPLTMFNSSKGTKDDLQYKCKECNRKYRESRRDEVLKANREYHKKHPERKLVYHAKYRAKEKGLPFNITVEDIKVPDFCPILQIPLIVGGGKISDNSPTIDRFIPDLGYVKGNVNVISHKANTIKNNASIEDIEAILEWMKTKEK